MTYEQYELMVTALSEIFFYPLLTWLVIFTGLSILAAVMMFVLFILRPRLAIF